MLGSESLGQTGVSFLQNAATRNLPFSEQIQFLENKGLSTEDIKVALQSVSSPPAKKDGWMWSLMYPVLIVGAGCAAYVLSKAMEEDNYEDTLTFPSDNEEDEDGMLEGREEFEPDGGVAYAQDCRDLTDGSSLNSGSASRQGSDSDVLRLVSVIERQTSAIQQAVELFTASVATTAAVTALSKEPLSESAVSEVGGSGESDKRVENAEEILERIRQVVIEMEERECDATGKAFGCIVMYLQKILDNPNVTRYHRLSTSNSTFKSSVTSLPRHEDLLEALGFQKNGSFWEWQSGSGHTKGGAAEERKGVYLQVLRECVVLLGERPTRVASPKEMAPPSSAGCLQASTAPSLESESSENLPIEHEIYSKSAAKENTMKFEEIFREVASSNEEGAQ